MKTFISMMLSSLLLNTTFADGNLLMLTECLDHFDSVIISLKEKSNTLNETIDEKIVTANKSIDQDVYDYITAAFENKPTVNLKGYLVLLKSPVQATERKLQNSFDQNAITVKTDTVLEQLKKDVKELCTLSDDLNLKTNK
jgi:hypothetical protein